jgi:hypothetical protein
MKSILKNSVLCYPLLVIISAVEITLRKPSEGLFFTSLFKMRVDEPPHPN